MADKDIYSGLAQLGAASDLPTSPEEATLEKVPNPHSDTLYLTRFVCPEFTSICPVTGQPDFAHLVIDYAPQDWLVESKSLKLYLTSFRNHGAKQYIGVGQGRGSVAKQKFKRFRRAHRRYVRRQNRQFAIGQGNEDLVDKIRPA